MEKLIHRIDLRSARGERARHFLRREWLVTNGLGGYASGTISGSISWRYHGLLIAALPAPLGRMVMLNHLAEFLRWPDGRLVQFGGEEPRRPLSPSEEEAEWHVTEFRLENQLPVWRYEIDGAVIEKTVLLVYGQNTVHVSYRLLSGPPRVQLELRPSFHFRHHEQAVGEPLREDYVVSIRDAGFDVTADEACPALRMAVQAEKPSFTYEGGTRWEATYPKEAERGNLSVGLLWNPGYFKMDLRQGQEAVLLASTESWSTMLAIDPPEALAFYHQRRQRLLAMAHPQTRNSIAGNLVLAADQFIITPRGRLADAARAHAAGDDIRTVIAGYHWFTDWGRDTMISLEGLTLATGRYVEAGWILRTFAFYIRHGLIPNLFPDKAQEGLYHTADATLWYFHALDRYLEYTHDRATLQLLLPKLIEIAQAHLRGTEFGIGMDPQDGLLRAGAEGFQLTWMDAKVEGWVVTPRRGKPVEINALWYNALRILENWVRSEQGDDAAQPWASCAERAREAFNRRFWNSQKNFLYDVIDGEHGDDPACRPNQLFAISLRYPVLDQRYWKPVLDVVEKNLLTPVGLRTLSPDHPDYKPQYFGDLRARDAAYHQGTVWAWLMGPFIDAWLKVHPDDRAGARKFLHGFGPSLDEGCVGSINEIYDAEPPFAPRGCIAQAWSVAEVLRAWIKTAPG